MVSISIFLMANNVEHHFMHLFAVCISSSCLLLIGLFFTVEFGEFFIYSSYKSVVEYMICKHFISVYNLSSHSSLLVKPCGLWDLSSLIRD